jgi:prephenate dehydrogenase
MNTGMEIRNLKLMVAPSAADGISSISRRNAISPAPAAWRDTTRIAAGDPELWADILLDNAGEVGDSMKRFAAATEKLLAAIERGDRRRLVELLTRAKDSRDALGS